MQCVTNATRAKDMEINAKKGRIEIPKDGKEKNYLANLFKVTPQMVWKALSFESDTDLAKKIRKAAIERGGQHVIELPIFETIHDANGYMRQQFPGGAELVAHKATGVVEVFYDGELIETFDDVNLSELERIQQLCATVK